MPVQIEVFFWLQAYTSSITKVLRMDRLPWRTGVCLDARDNNVSGQTKSRTPFCRDLRGQTTASGYTLWEIGSRRSLDLTVICCDGGDAALVVASGDCGDQNFSDS